MAAACILAGELARAGGDYRAAFSAYEALLQPLVASKQRAAERFARSFVPSSEFGIRVRNRVTHLMSAPLVARFLMGRLLKDTLALPNY
jgi:2-polyprenyl-6-methoxyphenol hydroxylase-like FAD-dependent oxidoreductase